MVVHSAWRGRAVCMISGLSIKRWLQITMLKHGDWLQMHLWRRACDRHANQSAESEAQRGLDALDPAHACPGIRGARADVRVHRSLRPRL